MTREATSWIKAAAVVLAVTMTAATAAATKPGTWTAGEDMSDVRKYMATATVEGIIGLDVLDIF